MRRNWSAANPSCAFACGSGDARLQPRRHDEAVDHFPRSQIELKRYPQIGGRIGDEVAADDADNQPGLAVELDGGADDFRVACKMSLPQTVAQHGNMTAIRAIFRCGEGASGNDRRAEQRKVSGGDMDGQQLLWMISTSEVDSGSAQIVGRYLLEDAGLLLPDVVIGDARDRIAVRGWWYLPVAPGPAGRDRSAA